MLNSKHLGYTQGAIIKRDVRDSCVHVSNKLYRASHCLENSAQSVCIWCLAQCKKNKMNNTTISINTLHLSGIFIEKKIQENF